MTRFVLRFVFHRLLTIRTPVGRKVRPMILSQGGPLIRVRQRDLDALNVERVPRTTGVVDGQPSLEDGRVLDATNVIWCNGFHAGLSWIDLPIFDADDHPRHVGGVVPAQPGLFFVGLPFLYSLSSTMVHGVGRDAARIVNAVWERTQTVRASQPAPRGVASHAEAEP